MTIYKIQDIEITKELRRRYDRELFGMTARWEWQVRYEFVCRKDKRVEGINYRYFETENAAHDYANKVRSGEIEPEF